MSFRDCQRFGCLPAAGVGLALVGGDVVLIAGDDRAVTAFEKD